MTDQSLIRSKWTENPENATGYHRRWFSAILAGRPRQSSSMSFTITFRTGKDEPWKWANDQFSFVDGHLSYPPVEPGSGKLSSYLRNISQELAIDEPTSQTPDTSLFTLRGKVEAASGTRSGRASHILGTPVNSTRWMALVRLWSPWLAPRHGKGSFALDKEAVLCSFLRDDGFHVVILAVSGIGDVLTELSNGNEGEVVMSVRNDAPEESEATVIVAVARTFELSNAAAMYHARQMVMSYESQKAENTTGEQPISTKNEFSAQWLEEWYDGLAYCTWNGLGQHLTESAIMDALDALEKNNISITNLIIDDNWQSLDNEGSGQFQRGWMDFEANKNGFPHGLAHTTAEIRRKYKNIAHIAVWHAILGYWGGISPDGKIAKEYKTIEVQKKPGVSGGKMLVVDEEDVSRLYSDFYSFLEKSGVDSVKTDAQFFLDELDDAPARRSLIKTYQDAWSISTLRYFSAKAISCMSLVPQIIFHSQLKTNKPRIMVRNSDDFFPEVPASHPWHIFCNAYNSLFTQHLNVLPDWDMFQTSHPWASFHAAARCVSGGPIYITDVPGKHDISLINQMTAKTPRGTTVILRPHTIGKTLNPYTSYDDHALLKVGTYVGMAHTGTSILGIFNTTQRPLTEFLTTSHFPGTESGAYIIRSHKSGRTSPPTSRSQSLPSLVHLDLPVQGWDILSASPARTYKLERSNNSGTGPPTITIAVLGLVGKMTGAAALVNSDTYLEQGTGRLRIWTSLKALGVYGIWISDLEHRSLEDDFLALMFGVPVSLEAVRKVGSGGGGGVLEIDLARAWRESDQRAGWSNEVAIEVFVR
ncbi:glycoside hydrolase family 36 protein [Saccharata proteae CBS 121410]|uniref:Glycoside hydrolase family 36 protein n=1 Tax=Saccharata proteae CBS 121410 TaxID=1314787 RepID=A0A9P4LVW3_9PEZI|nr:glycoside hydrolase family 36 protein [Saccharata proteae CBS 121410]